MEGDKKYIEMYWKCPYCDSKDIKGRYRECPHCGRPRSESTKFYFIEKDKYVDESEVEKGPDWMCNYCESYNPHSALECLSCGQPRTLENDDYFEVNRKKSLKSNYHREKSLSKSNENLESLDNHLDNHLDNVLDNHNKNNMLYKWRKPVVIALLVAIIVSVLTLGISALIPKTKEIAVTDKSWSRSIDIEEYKLVEDSDWTVPSDAVEVIDERQEIHHYNQVFDHYEKVQKSREVFDGYDTYYTYEDMGNGYGRQVEHQRPRYRTEYYYEDKPVYRDEPVYNTKYYYTIYKWVYEKTLKESGNNSTSPFWPDTSNLSDNERNGQKKESYSVTGFVKGKEKTYTCDYDVYSQLKVDFNYKVVISLGSITEVQQE